LAFATISDNKLGRNYPVRMKIYFSASVPSILRLPKQFGEAR
jgi:hypothetical protein